MPTEPITLSTSIRQNLLSLQNTTKLLDLTSNRLSTGLKVNSSLDNPAAFFAARSLTNRAGDLNVRKDGIGQAISLLQSTDKSLNALTSLVEQAKAKATEANEAATGGIRTISSEKAATVTGFTTISTSFAAVELAGREDRHRHPARDDALHLAPARNAAGVLEDDLRERGTEGQLE